MMARKQGLFPSYFLIPNFYNFTAETFRATLAHSLLLRKGKMRSSQCLW